MWLGIWMIVFFVVLLDIFIFFFKRRWFIIGELFIWDGRMLVVGFLFERNVERLCEMYYRGIYSLRSRNYIRVVFLVLFMWFLGIGGVMWLKVVEIEFNFRVFLKTRRRGVEDVGRNRDFDFFVIN